jgi:YVTN family beta-propeller protein
MSRCQRSLPLRAAALKWLLPAIFAVLSAGCHPAISTVRPALVDEGELFLYLEPLSPELSPLTLDLGELSALRSDGVEIPLTLHLSRISSATSARQRFLASGVLPPGNYLGISAALRRAVLKTSEGEAVLPVPDRPERFPFPFPVKAKKGTLLSLELRNREVVKKGSPFHLSFSIAIPEKPLLTLTGYVTNYGANTITIFDKKAGAVRGVIVTGQGPRGVVFDQKKRVGYLALEGEDAIDVIDLSSNDTVNRIRLVYGDRPGELALTPDGKTLLSVNTGSNSVSFIDPVTLVETARVNVGKDPVSILLDRSGTKAYVLNYLSNTISAIDLATRTVFATLQTESGPLRADFNRAGDRLLVTHEWSPNLLVIDAATNVQLKSVFVGDGLVSVKVEPNTDRVYIGRRHDPVVQVFDPFSLVPSDFLIAAGAPYYDLFDAESSNMLLVLPEQKALEAISLVSKKPQYLIDVDDDPFRSAIMGQR